MDRKTNFGELRNTIEDYVGHPIGERLATEIAIDKNKADIEELIERIDRIENDLVEIKLKLH